MKRQVTMEEISDGKLYTSNDMVKADCYYIPAMTW